MGRVQTAREFLKNREFLGKSLNSIYSKRESPNCPFFAQFNFYSFDRSATNFTYVSDMKHISNRSESFLNCRSKYAKGTA